MNRKPLHPVAERLSDFLRGKNRADYSAPNPAKLRRALIVGYFSTTQHQATFGDTAALHVVLTWLRESGLPYDVACHPANGMKGLDWTAVNPGSYSHLIFVCGPWSGKSPTLKPFDHCLKIGINLSLETAENHGFDLLLPRDMPGCANPDLVFASQTPELPLAGIAKVHPQPIYGDRQRHERVNGIIDQYLERREVAGISLSTLWLNNPTSVENTLQFENLIRRMDVVITSRLHGLVFSLKNGIPVVAIDPVAGGAKITAQAKAVGWPLVFDGSNITVEELRNAVNCCLNGTMQDALMRIRTDVAGKLNLMKREFQQMLLKPALKTSEDS